MKRTALWLAAAMLSQAAHGVTFVDAFAPVEPACADCADASYFLGGNFWLAQTFTVATDGTRVGLPVASVGGLGTRG